MQGLSRENTDKKTLFLIPLIKPKICELHIYNITLKFRPLAPRGMSLVVQHCLFVPMLGEVDYVLARFRKTLFACLVKQAEARTGMLTGHLDPIQKRSEH